MDRFKRVVITGVGPISSLGIGSDEVWENAVNAKTGLKVEDFSDEGEIIDRYFLHKIKDFKIENFGLDPLILEDIVGWKKGEREGDLDLFLATIKLALNDSDLQYDRERNSIGLILTAESPGHGELFKKMIDYFFPMIRGSEDFKNRFSSKKKFYDDIFEKFKFTCYDLQTFMSLFHVGKVFGFHGHSLHINNACSSGLYALESAADLIRSGKCPVVLVSAVDFPNIFKSLWFKNLNMSPHDGKIKPFCEEADGFVLGEGGAAIVLEDLNFAEERGAKIYAEYLGGAFNSESWKVIFPAISMEFYKDVLRESLSRVDIDAKDVDVIVPHGVGTAIVDRHEYNTINSVFGGNPNRPLISAFKPYVGHCLGGSSLLEVALLLMCFQKGLLLPILNSKNFYRNNTLNFISESIKTEINCALKICASFAGFNAAVIFRKMR